MTQRRQRRRRQRAANAIARGDEPPDPFFTPTVIAATIGAVGAGASAGIAAHSAKKNREAAAKQNQLNQPKATPLAGSSTELKPGQIANLKNTGPQGLLTPATTGRSSLLGG